MRKALPLCIVVLAGPLLATPSGWTSLPGDDRPVLPDQEGLKRIEGDISDKICYERIRDLGVFNK